MFGVELCVERRLLFGERLPICFVFCSICIVIVSVIGCLGGGNMGMFGPHGVQVLVGCAGAAVPSQHCFLMLCRSSVISADGMVYQC